MSIVIPGRFTAEMSDPFVVFLIGVRVNNIWAINKWVPVVQAMGPMLSSLRKYPEKGLLGKETFFRPFPISVVLISYWKSYDHLEHFARSSDDPHLESWRKFNQSIGSDGSVGVWHETYLIQPGQSESVYANMPVFGLASATKHVPAVGRKETSRRRLGGENEPAVAID